MKQSTLLSLLFAFCVSCTSSATKENSTTILEWEDLIDSDLTKWDTYLSFQHQEGYDGTAPADADGKPIAPIGLNKPGYMVFTTKEENGELIVHNTGKYYGCLVTQKEYKNYHFQLKYKWGDKKWAFRKNLLKDSGILYHSIGAHGAEFWRSWMLSQEFQIMEGHTGDYWCQATSAIDIRAYKPESNLDPVAHETQDFLPFSMDGPYRNYCMRKSDFESPAKEWTTLDLYCFEGKSLHMVNGNVVMVLKNSRYKDSEGKMVPLTKGKIQLQSEAGEVFYKDIRIREINSLSPAQSKLF